MSVHQLSIVGLGMMGGAIGMAARRTGAATRVIGVADTMETMELAKAKGAVDEATLDVRAAVQNADLVILCVPVRVMIDAVAAVIPACREGTVIADVGSSKTILVRQAEALCHKLKSKAHFVGCHPVTGSEKKGLEASDQVVLAGAPCVLTPTQHTDIEASRRAEEFWKSLGMKTFRMSPEEHDLVLARSSHVPHLVAAALMSLQSDRSLEISGPGLRDMTRLTGSDPAMWVDIITHNGPEIGKALKELGQEFLRLSEEVEALGTQAGDTASETSRERIFRFLADARQRHDKRYPQVPKNAPAEPLPAESEEAQENTWDATR